MDTGNSERAPAAPRPSHRALITPKITLAATVLAFTAAAALYLLHLTKALPLGELGIGLWCVWLLGIGSVGFLTTFLRVTLHMLADDWRVGVAFGDLNHLPVIGPGFDALLADGAPPNLYLRAGLWPVFSWAAGMCWGIAALLTFIVAAGGIRPPSSDSIIALVIVLTPATLCTAGAVNGPPLTRQYQMRNVAALAHHRLSMMQQKTNGARAVTDALADTAEIPPAALHVVNGHRANGRAYGHQGASNN